MIANVFRLTLFRVALAKKQVQISRHHLSGLVVCAEMRGRVSDSTKKHNRTCTKKSSVCTMSSLLENKEKRLVQHLIYFCSSLLQHLTTWCPKRRCKYYIDDVHKNTLGTLFRIQTPAGISIGRYNKMIVPIMEIHSNANCNKSFVYQYTVMETMGKYGSTDYLSFRRNT